MGSQYLPKSMKRELSNSQVFSPNPKQKLKYNGNESLRCGEDRGNGSDCSINL